MHRPLLLAIVPGAGYEDLTTAATPELAARLEGHSAVRRLHGAPIEPQAELARGDWAQGLWDLGAAIDRRSLVLRRPGQSDQTTLADLDRVLPRPADLTLLWLGDVLRAAILAGPLSPGHRHALAQLEAQLQRARSSLRVCGQEPELAVWTLWPCRPVARHFAPEARLRALARQLAWSRRLQPRFTLRAGLLRAVCSSWRQVGAVSEALHARPFAQYGRLVTAAEAQAFGYAPAAHELWFVPHADVAFGPGRVRGRPDLLGSTPAANGCALLPWQRAPVFDLGWNLAFAATIARVGAYVQTPAGAQTVAPVAVPAAQDAVQTP